jgi:UDP-GlcNAc:undecaprenyl-phosphate GlcNAc-1-phosphate transferase
MRLGLTQQRTTVILYIWTAMFALPTVIAAFVPAWIAILSGAFIFSFSALIIKNTKDNSVR